MVFAPFGDISCSLKIVSERLFNDFRNGMITKFSQRQSVIDGLVGSHAEKVFRYFLKYSKFKIFCLLPVEKCSRDISLEPPES